MPTVQDSGRALDILSSAALERVIHCASHCCLRRLVMVGSRQVAVLTSGGCCKTKLNELMLGWLSARYCLLPALVASLWLSAKPFWQGHKIRVS